MFEQHTSTIPAAAHTIIFKKAIKSIIAIARRGDLSDTWQPTMKAFCTTHDRLGPPFSLSTIASIVRHWFFNVGTHYWNIGLWGRRRGRTRIPHGGWNV